MKGTLILLHFAYDTQTEAIMKQFMIAFVLWVLACAVAHAQSKIIRVPQDQATIQAGINTASNGDTVLVAEGTYSVNLLLKKKIVLGSLFILDGDTAHVSKTVLDGGSPKTADSASVICITTGTDSTTVISGFTIRNGHGTRHQDPSDGRYWRGGGGISIHAGGASITHNIIGANSISSTDGVYGGGISMTPVDGPISFWAMEDNVIKRNSIYSSASSFVGAEGGGVWLTEDGRFTRNTVDSNSVSGVNYGVSGGVHVGGFPGYGTTNIQFISNRIRRNSASAKGGGFGLFGFSGANLNLSFVNNLVVGNSATAGGGFFVGDSCLLTLVNNTVADNTAGWESGIWVNGTDASNSKVIGINNIFWNKGNTFDEFWGLRFGSMENNLIRGETALGQNNFSADPQFAADGSYSLTVVSPCIGAGTTSRMLLGTQLQAPATDLNGNLRPQPSGSATDIGAIESELGTGSAEHPNRAESHSFVFGGVTRSYAVIRPKGHESESNQGVIVFLHGYGDNVNWAMNYNKIQDVGDSLHFLSVYPQAFDCKWNSGISDNPAAPTPSVDDVGFISALIDSLRVQYGVDTNRVYVAGHSNGGFMAFRLAAQLAHKIKSIAAVSSELPNSVASNYTATIQIPVFMINCTSDPTVPYAGKTGWYGAQATVDFWRTKNNATVSADTLNVANLDPYDQSTVVRYRYKNTDGRPMVWFYKITGGSHEWPGGPNYYGAGAITRDIDANWEIYNFITDRLTSVYDKGTTIPQSFALGQNFPNPFNPSTTIQFHLPVKSRVRLHIFNLLGQHVAELANEEVNAGYFQKVWNANVASGLYFYRLEAVSVADPSKRFVDVKKMILLK